MHQPHNKSSQNENMPGMLLNPIFSDSKIDPRPLIGEPVVRLGLAYSPYFSELLDKHPELIDYVEMPYELLIHDPSIFSKIRGVPIVLHCASLSIAGTVAPNEGTIVSISDWVDATRTPWLGEHLAFVLAEKPGLNTNAEEYAPGEPYNIGYTASPPMNSEALDRVVRTLEVYNNRFRAPLIIENSPLYFHTPGSTMSQVDFIRRICEESEVGLLLDLTHFLITARNMGFDPQEEIQRYPLDRVVEIHVSGTEFQSGIHWDNHATHVPEEVFQLLETALTSTSVRAITLEYNWISRYPKNELVKQLRQVREMVTRKK